MSPLRGSSADVDDSSVGILWPARLLGAMGLDLVPQAGLAKVTDTPVEPHGMRAPITTRTPERNGPGTGPELGCGIEITEPRSLDSLASFLVNGPVPLV
jgi:hypothetical protein